MKLAPETLAKLENARDFDFAQMQYLLKSNMNTVWSWGARKYTKVYGKGFSFLVSGRHFKGYVTVSVNPSDLYDISFSNNRGTLKDTIENIYVEDLISTIDNKVERISTYVR